GEALFWEALNAERHDQIPGVIAALEAETRARPAAPRAYLLLGATQLWRLAEPDLSRLQDARPVADACVATLTTYQALAPGDRRVATWLAQAFYGQAQGLVAAAQRMPPSPARDAMGAQAGRFLASALATIDRGVAEEP